MLSFSFRKSTVAIAASILFLVPAVMFSSSMTQTATCAENSYLGNSNDVGTGGCSATVAGYGNARASSSVNYALAGNSLTITGGESVNVLDAGPVPIGPSTSSYASVQTTFSLSVATSGSGPGYLELYESIVPSVGGSGYTAMSITGLPGLSYCSDGGPACTLGPTFYAVTLGQNIDITLTMNVGADDSDGAGDVFAGLQIQGNFFGPDKTTPIDVTETPEPGTLSALAGGGGFLALAVLIKKLRSRGIE